MLFCTWSNMGIFDVFSSFLSLSYDPALSFVAECCHKGNIKLVHSGSQT